MIPKPLPNPNQVVLITWNKGESKFSIKYSLEEVELHFNTEVLITTHEPLI
jgi:hypothetical protein